MYYLPKVKVTYKNLGTGRIGTPIHTLPKYTNWSNPEEYLKAEVQRWNRDNRLVSWQFVTNDINPNHIPSSVIEAREKEIEEVWRPQLKEIATETCVGLNRPIDNEGFTLTYNKHYTGYAQISYKTRHIEVGHKFFNMTMEDKRRVLKHEVSHVILSFHTHNKSAGEILSKADIPLHAPIQYRIDRAYKYEVYCNGCHHVVAKRKSSSAKVIKNVGNYHCARCGSSNLVVRRI